MSSTYVSVGEFKGRKLGAKFTDRPTQQKVRQAVFNILADRIQGAQILDLCCGTGVFGIEALSLGAAHVSFVDQNISVVKENTQFLEGKLKGRTFDCLKSSTQAYICRASRQYDMIFFDPPWRDLKTYEETLGPLLSQDILRKAGIMVIEHHKKQDILQWIDPAFMRQSRQYGDAAIEICQL